MYHARVDCIETINVRDGQLFWQWACRTSPAACSQTVKHALPRMQQRVNRGAKERQQCRVSWMFDFCPFCNAAPPTNKVAPKKNECLSVATQWQRAIVQGPRRSDSKYICEVHFQPFQSFISRISMRCSCLKAACAWHLNKRRGQGASAHVKVRPLSWLPPALACVHHSSDCPVSRSGQL
jgi:hypothetical protein